MKKKFIKRICSIVLAGVLTMTLVPVSAKAEGEMLTGKTAMEITQMMGKGFNFGNTLDATGGSGNDIEAHETSWGNPVINKDMMHSVKEAGFTSVRIPITWMKHIDKDNNYKITDEFMARVKEVVDLAYDEGLFVIINVHHESWVNRKDLGTAYEEVGKELSAVWAQVAEEFAEYDQHLIFEGMNEPRAEGTANEWTGDKSGYDAVAYLDQLFVEAVRGNGKGHNNERVLMIPGYAASSNPIVLRQIKMPEIDGVQVENIAVSVHCYSPYNFCLSDDQVTFDPNKSADTADIKSLMTNLKTLFLNQGIPVVLGECGCTNSNDNNEARLAWFKFFGEITAEYGIPAIVWDNGAGGKSGGECHKYFNRKTGEVLSQDLINAFVGVYDPGSLSDMVIDFESIKTGDGTHMIDPEEVGFTSNTLNCMMKVNHTEGQALGFSLKVEAKEKDFTALLNVSQYANVPIKVTAWVSSEEEDVVSVGTVGSSETEMASVETSSEWTKVSFICTPEAGRFYIYFKGNASTFYVDDIEISMDVSEDVVEGDFGTSVSVDVTDTNTSSSDNVVAEETSKISPAVIVLGVTAVIAVIAVGVIVIGGKKKKD